MSAKSELIVTERAVVNFKKLVENCPQATDAELRKLLSIQGAILNQVGIELLLSSRESERRREKILKLALVALDGSRNALAKAASIQVSAEPE